MNEAEMAAVNAGVQPEATAAEGSMETAAENRESAGETETVASAAAVNSVFDKLPAEGLSVGQNEVVEASASVGSKDVSPTGNVNLNGNSGTNGADQSAGVVEVSGVGENVNGADSAAVDTMVEGTAETEVPGAADAVVPGSKENGNADGKQTETAVSNHTVAPTRDYEAEWKELAEAHPEVVGTTLPEDIFQACIKSDQPPLRVYESMMLQRMRDEVERLKQENDRLRQNETNAQRAPVTGTLAGGATDTKEEDPFIAGFNRYR